MENKKVENWSKVQLVREVKRLLKATKFLQERVTWKEEYLDEIKGEIIKLIGADIKLRMKVLSYFETI